MMRRDLKKRKRDESEMSVMAENDGADCQIGVFILSCQSQVCLLASRDVVLQYTTRSHFHLTDSR